jgi:serine/threonine-protein kinase RsbW
LCASLRKTWTFAAELHAVDRVCQDAATCLQELDLSRLNFAVQMLLREALNNAVIHGSDCDASKQVVCEMWTEQDWLHIRVEDQGLGFDWSCVLLRPVAAQEQECGRGLLVYRLYADQIDFNPSGSCIHLSLDLNKNTHIDANLTDQVQGEKE